MQELISNTLVWKLGMPQFTQSYDYMQMLMHIFSMMRTRRAKFPTTMLIWRKQKVIFSEYLLEIIVQLGAPKEKEEKEQKEKEEKDEEEGAIQEEPPVKRCAT